MVCVCPEGGVTVRDAPSLGLLDAGAPGAVLVARLLRAGHQVTVWNGSGRGSYGPAPNGAEIVDSVAGLAHRDVVFLTSDSPEGLEALVTGPSGLLSGWCVPTTIVNCSRVDAQLSARMREAALAAGAEYLAMPIGGDPLAIAPGEAVLPASGPREAFERVAPLLGDMAKSAVWVGPAEQAALVQVCHALYLGMIVQALSEVTTLAEKSGVPRDSFLLSLNGTHLATEWLRRRTPDLLALDWTPVHTTEVLRDAFDLGLAAARTEEVPMPVAVSVHQRVQEAIGRGYRYADFLALFQIQAESAGMDVTP